MSRDLSLDELKQTIEKLVTMLEEKYKLFLNDAKRELLVDHITQTLTQDNKKSYTKEDLLQPDFIKKLAFSIAAAMTAENNGKFSEVIKNTFKEKGLKLDDIAKLTPDKFKELLKNNFTPAELKKLHNKLLNNSEAVSTKLEEKLNHKLSPESKSTFANEIANAAFINMFGLLTKETGTIMVPVFSFNGNYMNITDYNPNDGYAQIDLANSLKDTAFGDPQGLNRMAKENYESISGTIVNSFSSIVDEVLTEHHKPSNWPPKPTPFGQ